jgi:adenosylhomocysteine nucleosidase
MKIEAKPFLKALKNKRMIKHPSQKIYLGVIDDSEVMVVCCGVGMKNAAFSVQSLVNMYDISQIIMSGTAGGVDKKLKIGDTVISDEILYHDRVKNKVIHDSDTNEDIPFMADAILLDKAAKAIDKEPPAHPVYFGRITTGNTFVNGKNRDTIAERFKSLCADMETAAAAHSCYINTVPFIAVRSITDTREKSGIAAFIRYAQLASKRSFTIVKMLLK